MREAVFLQYALQNLFRQMADLISYLVSDTAICGTRQVVTLKDLSKDVSVFIGSMSTI